MDKKSLQDILIQLRGATNWSQKEFAEYFNIPRRTLQEWEYGNRKMPEYLLQLMVYKLKKEKIVTNFPDIFEKSLKKNEFFENNH